MKKILIVLCILVIPLFATAHVTSDLRYGQSGDQVASLQELLVSRGYLKSKVTGFFGSLTLNAVKLYQSALGLPTTGFVGPLTRSRVNSEMLAQVIQTTTSSNTVTYTVAEDSNQEGTTMDSGAKTIWLGTGANTTSSYTGLKFNGVQIPKGAKITSAVLEVYSPQQQWISLDLNIFGDKSGNSQSFSVSNLSSRVLTQSKLTHSTNENWLANNWYKFSDLSPVVQEVIDSSDWQQGNSVTLISRGNGGAYSRKYVTSLDGSLTNSPRLTITYTTSSTPTPTAPTAPSALSATAQGTSQINLSWTDNSGDETGFRIERKTGTGTYAEVATVGSNVTSYQNTGLSSATQYSYRVRAYNTAGNSAYSNEVSATTQTVVITPTPIPTNAGSALRFYGNGNDGIDRVKIPLDNPNRTIDVRGNFTVEFWLKMSITENGSSSCTTGNDNWTKGNVVIDRDIFGDGDMGDYGISVAGGRVAFGVNNGTSGAGICGTTNVADNNWHHIAVTRSSSNGALAIYVNGNLDGQGSGPLGDLSYRDGRVTSYPNDAFVVIGAEKHDYDKNSYPSFSGHLDEVRFSNSVRYSSNFTRPNSPFNPDSFTVALYHFDEGSGNVVSDSTGQNNGTRHFGGLPAGPVWVTSDAPLGNTQTTPPSPTSDIKVNNSDTGVSITNGTSVTLTWTSSNATSCTVSPVSLTGLNGTQSVTPSVTTTYTLTCTNTGGSSSDSVTVTVSTVPTVNPPTAPSALSATAQGTSQINLSWTDNSGDETGFRIERKTGTGTYAEVATVGSNVTSYQNTGLSSATQYSYRVRAYNTAGNSAYSNEVSANTDGVVTIGKFTINQRVQTTSRVRVRATPSTSGTSLGTQPLGALGSILAGPTSANGYNWWRVNYDSGVDGWSVENFLSALNVTPPPGDTTPPVISGVALSNLSSSGVTISWTTNESATSGVEYGLTNTYGTTVNSSGTVAHSVTLTGLNSSTMYEYRVVATDTSGNTSNSTNQMFTTLTSSVGTTTTTVGGNSKAMGLWTPSRWDTCTKAEHDSYYVIGPDGKKYPTWHPPQHTRPDGTKCSFGHEHGRDPKNSEIWRTKQIQNYFYFDANNNGLMDPSEEAVSGLPFGYVNEQLDSHSLATGQSVHRHEDHVGHKVDYANGEGEIATHQMSTSITGGVWVGKNGDGFVAKDTGVRCYYLAKPHQGVSSVDAFTNNIHEVFYFSDCRHSNPVNNQKISIAKLVAFGDAGGFTKFMPMCGVERRSDPQDRVFLGLSSTNSQYPNGEHGSDREIITRDCIEKGFLVPDGQWSGNLYEAWPANLTVRLPNGNALIDSINLLFDVEDANRYFYPEELKAQRGYNNTSAGRNLGFTMDLCYDNSLASQGRIARGGPCSWSTNYGQIKDITWDDPRSGFRGINRGMYFQPAKINNSGGPELWYTDPFGNNARTSYFTGSVKQQITSRNIDYSTLINDTIDPRVNNRLHSDGNGTVHAPN